MDLLSAAGFLGAWLMRDQLAPETARMLLFWPVVFEMFAAFALFLAGMGNSMRSATLRHAWFGFVAASYFFASWLSGALMDMPHAWTLALWLLLARLAPAPGLRLGSRAHREWLWLGAGYSGMLWGAGFVATILLGLVFSTDEGPGPDGIARSTAAAWIVPLVWTPYFIAEAVIRAWRQIPAPRP